MLKKRTCEWSIFCVTLCFYFDLVSFVWSQFKIRSISSSSKALLSVIAVCSAQNYNQNLNMQSYNIIWSLQCVVHGKLFGQSPDDNFVSVRSLFFSYRRRLTISSDTSYIKYYVRQHTGFDYRMTTDVRCPETTIILFKKKNKADERRQKKEMKRKMVRSIEI